MGTGEGDEHQNASVEVAASHPKHTSHLITSHKVLGRDNQSTLHVFGRTRIRNKENTAETGQIAQREVVAGAIRVKEVLVAGELGLQAGDHRDRLDKTL